MTDINTRKDEYIHIIYPPPFKCSALDSTQIEDDYVLLLQHWCLSSEPVFVYSGPTVANMTMLTCFFFTNIKELMLLKCFIIQLMHSDI